MQRKRSIIVAALGVFVVVAAVPTAMCLAKRAKARRDACLKNLEQLAAPMICCVPLSQKLSAGDKLEEKQVCAYLAGGVLPTCPAGGTYEISWVVCGPTPKCSTHGDLLLEAHGAKSLADLTKQDLRHK